MDFKERTSESEGGEQGHRSYGEGFVGSRPATRLKRSTFLRIQKLPASKHREPFQHFPRSRIRHLCGDKTDGIRDHPGSESLGAVEEFRLIHEQVADNVAAAGDADDIGAVCGEDSFGENLR